MERVLDDPAKKAKITKMAISYLTGRCSQDDLAAKYKVSRATVYKYFHIYLPQFSPQLAKVVAAKCAANEERGRKRGLKIMLKLQNKKNK